MNAIRPAVDRSTRFKHMLRLFSRKRALYLMMFPGILFFLCFHYAPMYGASIAFKDYVVRKGIAGSPWADPWYKYFLQFFRSPYFSQLLGNTLIISISKLVFSVPTAIFFAVALNEIRSTRFRRVVQTITYLPHFLSWVIVYGVLYAMLSETRGLVNMLIKSTTGSSINFLSSPKWFRTVIVLSDLWKETGWNAIVYLAAIIGIDPTLYEAARVDGAGRFQAIRHVTLPGIRSVVVIMLLLNIGALLDAGFDQVYILYNVQVYSVGDIIDTWVYRTGLSQWNFSLASAVGLFKSVIGTMLLFMMNALARRWGESLW